MYKKQMLFVAIILMAFNSCQDKVKSDLMNKKRDLSPKIDLAKVNFDEDFSSLIKTGDYKQKRCKITEYLTARRTIQLDTFRLGSLEFQSDFKIQDMSIPSDSYLSLITKDEISDSLMTIRMEYNFIGKEDYLVNKIKADFGEPEKLSKEGSSNEFHGLKNYLWSNITPNKSIVFSQSSYGSAVGIDSDLSEKIYTAEIYIIKNDVIIYYPNGQNASMLEKVTDEYSW